MRANNLLVKKARLSSSSRCLTPQRKPKTSEGERRRSARSRCAQWGWAFGRGAPDHLACSGGQNGTAGGRRAEQRREPRPEEGPPGAGERVGREPDRDAPAGVLAGGTKDGEHADDDGVGHGRHGREEDRGLGSARDGPGYQQQRQEREQRERGHRKTDPHRPRDAQERRNRRNADRGSAAVDQGEDR